MTVAFGWWFLLLQTFLLMLAAFLLGAMFACVARRAFYDLPEDQQVKPAAERQPLAPVPAPAPVAVKPQAASVTSSVPPVSPRATVPPPKPAPTAAPVKAPESAPVAAQSSAAASAVAASTPPAAPLPSGRQLDTARFERALTGEGAASKSAPAVRPPEPKMADAAKAAAAAAAATVATVAASVPVVAKPAPASTASPAPAPAPAPQPITVQAPSAGGSGGPASAAAEVVTAPPADDLTRISGIDAVLARALAAAGITRYQQIAGWTAADVAATTAKLSLGPRISRENWIEQAQVLAKGQETAYARRRRRGEAVVAAPAPAPTPTPAAAGTPAVPTAVAATAAVAAPVVVARAADATASPASAAAPAPPPAAPAPKPAVEASPPPAPDDLQRIRGITPEIVRALAANGVTRFGDIAAWTAADVARFDQLLAQPGQIARGNWIEQAHILARGSTTTYSRSAEVRQRVSAPALAEPEPSRPARLADAIKEQSERSPGEARAGRPDVAGLRSVRSELLVGDGGDSQARVTIGRAGADDLKRIRGIGVLIEKKLNSLGVARYDQIANWTGADIDRMSQLLDFRGRIERENWVEQARILASGGQTEFSRRVDKGDVESSRDPSRG
jgi:predicted flap endonuclease-1-like 5' DNA nuclease